MERGLTLEVLEEALSWGPKALVGNRGFRRYLVAEKGTFRIDPKKVKEEARYDGKWVLRTNTDLPAAEVALQYKRLLLVEEFFRAAKSLLETRPIFHKFESTIRGHIFVSFLALLLLHELKERLKRKGIGCGVEGRGARPHGGAGGRGDAWRKAVHPEATAQGGGGEGVRGGGRSGAARDPGSTWCQDRCPGVIVPFGSHLLIFNCKKMGFTRPAEEGIP